MFASLNIMAVKSMAKLAEIACPEEAEVMRAFAAPALDFQAPYHQGIIRPPRTHESGFMKFDTTISPSLHSLVKGRYPEVFSSFTHVTSNIQTNEPPTSM